MLPALTDRRERVGPRSGHCVGGDHFRELRDLNRPRVDVQLVCELEDEHDAGPRQLEPLGDICCQQTYVYSNERNKKITLIHHHA